MVTTVTGPDGRGWTRHPNSPILKGADPYGSIIDPDAFYVDKNHVSASDSNVGSESSPWETIQKAANTLVAGQRVYVKAGTYVENTGTWNAIEPQNSGTSESNRIIYEAYPNESVIIDSENNGRGFAIIRKKYITIRGFEIINGTSGIWVTTDNGGLDGGSVEYITIEDNIIHDMNSFAGDNVGGINFNWNTNGIIRNNLIYNIFIDGGTSNNNCAGILSYGMQDALIENNTFHTTSRGIFHKLSTGAIGCLVQKNLFYNLNTGIFYGIAGSGNPPHINQRATQNIMYDVGGCVDCWETQVSSIHSGLHVWNNTFVGATFNGITAGFIEGVNYYNNIFSDMVFSQNFGAINYKSTFDVDVIDFNNYFNSEKFLAHYYEGNQTLYNSLAAWVSGEGFDTNSITSDPDFVNAGTRDYRLGVDSPSRTAGRFNNEPIGAYKTGLEKIGYVA